MTELDRADLDTLLAEEPLYGYRILQEAEARVVRGDPGGAPGGTAGSR